MRTMYTIEGAVEVLSDVADSKGLVPVRNPLTGVYGLKRFVWLSEKPVRAVSVTRENGLVTIYKMGTNEELTIRDEDVKDLIDSLQSKPFGDREMVNSRDLIKHVVERMTPDDADVVASSFEVQVRGVWAKMKEGRLRTDSGEIVDAGYGEITAVRASAGPGMKKPEGSSIVTATTTGDLVPRTPFPAK